MAVDRYLDRAGRTSAQNIGPHCHTRMILLFSSSTPKQPVAEKNFLPLVVRRVADRAVTSFQATSFRLRNRRLGFPDGGEKPEPP